MIDKTIDRVSITLQKIADHIYNLPESTMRVCQKYEKENTVLVQLTGHDITELVALFAAGYTLEPPKYEDNKLSDLEDIGE